MHAHAYITPLRKKMTRTTVLCYTDRAVFILLSLKLLQKLPAISN